MAKDSNIIITGTGGQGVMTLLDVAATAAMIEGYDVKSSELHGLSQRGGTVLTYLKFGDKIYSPLFGPGRADIILGLELLETLRATTFSNNKTNIIANKKFIHFDGAIPEGNVLVTLNEATKANLYLVGASEICQKELGKEVVSGIYLLGYASFNNLIGLKSISIIKAIEKIVPQKYLDLNLKAFNLANSKT